jgi:hypothetical protein
MLPGMHSRKANYGSYGVIVPFTDEWYMSTAAGKQAAKAAAGSRLSSFSAREDAKHFAPNRLPGAVTDAHFHAAYWMGVASRLVGSGALAQAAAIKMGRAQAQAVVPGSTTVFRGSPEEIAAPLAEAAALIQQHAGQHPDAATIVAYLNPSARALTRAREEAKGGTAGGMVEETGRSVTRPFRAWLSVFGLMEPDERDKWLVWPARIAMVLVPLGGLTAFATRPARKAARRSRQNSSKRIARKNGDALIVRDRKPDDGLADDVNPGESK